MKKLWTKLTARLTDKHKYYILFISGLVMCILPPTIATLCYFPLWFRDESSTISIISVFVLLLCAIPARRVLSKMLKSPAAWMIWLFLWVTCVMLDAIIPQLKVIASIGCPASVVGAFLFFFARKYRKRAGLDE